MLLLGVGNNGAQLLSLIPLDGELKVREVISYATEAVDLMESGEVVQFARLLDVHAWRQVILGCIVDADEAFLRLYTINFIPVQTTELLTGTSAFHARSDSVDELEA